MTPILASAIHMKTESNRNQSGAATGQEDINSLIQPHHILNHTDHSSSFSSEVDREEVTEVIPP